MRSSSMVAAERPTLAPPYQPVPCALASGAEQTASTARPSIPDVLVSFIFFPMMDVRAALREPAR